MYRKLILGILLSVSLSATYYVVFSGGGNVLSSAITNDVTPSYNTPTIEMISGIYSCSKQSGCLATSTLTLKDDNTAEMITSPLKSVVMVTTPGSEEVSTSATDSVDYSNTQETETTTLVREDTLEKGTWDLGANNILIINLTDSGTSTYDRVHKMIAQRVSTSTIQKITFAKDLFPFFAKPIFTREEY